jgi:hypothetical protein
MTKPAAETISEFPGWTIGDWSLLPHRLFSLELNYFQGLHERGNCAKIFCIRPSLVSLQWPRKAPGEMFNVISARLNQVGNSVQLEIGTSGPERAITTGADQAVVGRAVVAAEDIQVFHY